MPLDVDCIFMTLLPDGLDLLFGPFTSIANRDPGDNNPFRRRGGPFENWAVLATNSGNVRVPFGLVISEHPEAILETMTRFEGEDVPLKTGLYWQQIPGMCVFRLVS